MQAGLAEDAARERGTGNRSERSPLAGKPFDETGDRLTPSHASKRGVRHRYYVSHRLVQPGGASDGAGWRLRARALEQAIVQGLVDFGRGAAILEAWEKIKKQTIRSRKTGPRPTSSVE